MRCACIDIGSNTTRVLVADVDGGHLREVICEKAYTRLGNALRRTGSLPAEALDAVAEVVAAQRAVAFSLGAQRLRVVATAAIRSAANAGELARVVRERAGLEVDVLGGEEEARLAFAGAVHAHPGPLPDRVAVVDVGGGSTEVAVGTVAGGVEWSLSLPVGSGSLADDHLRSDPPGAEQLRAVAEAARKLLAACDAPPADLALAVGGSATSMGRLMPGAIDHRSVSGAIALLSAAQSGEVAAGHGLDPERVRLLPAGLELLAAVGEQLGCPLTIGDGGLREGVCLQLAFTSGR